MLQWIVVYGALTILDFVWARYNLATADKRVWAASSYSVAIILLSGVSVISYSHDPWLLIPAAAGAFTGTFIAVKLEAAKEPIATH